MKLTGLVQKVQELKKSKREKNYPRTRGHWVVKLKKPTKRQYKERKAFIKAHNCET